MQGPLLREEEGLHLSVLAKLTLLTPVNRNNLDRLEETSSNRLVLKGKDSSTATISTSNSSSTVKAKVMVSTFFLPVWLALPTT